MTTPDLTHPHRRFNPLRGEWVIVSPHRTHRPWQGEVSPHNLPPPTTTPPATSAPATLALAAARNPAYTRTFVFENDFPALLPHVRPTSISADAAPPRPVRTRPLPRPLLPPRPLPHPRPHGGPRYRRRRRRLGRQSPRALGALPWIQPRPDLRESRRHDGRQQPPPPRPDLGHRTHPRRAPPRTRLSAAYHDQHHPACSATTPSTNSTIRNRIVCRKRKLRSRSFPSGPSGPSKPSSCSLDHTSALADLHRRQQSPTSPTSSSNSPSRYDDLFESQLPLHHGLPSVARSPDRGRTIPVALPRPLLPPLLRSATVRKFMVGFEMLAMPQRDITPESAAARLRDLPSLQP